MAWVMLILAGLCECGWAIGLKYVHGFRQPGVLLLIGLSMGASLGGLTLALRSLPVGTAYAVWTGVGAVGTATLGIWLFGEPATVWRLLSIGLVVAGLIGLKLAT